MSPKVTIEDLRARLAEQLDGYAAKTGCTDWWRRPPLMVSAKADSRFDALKDIIAPDHLLPRDLLPTAKSVIVFFLPFKRELMAGNIKGRLASEDWGQSYKDTNQLIAAISESISDFLTQADSKSTVITPPTYNFDPKRLISQWSHKHLGYFSGLGRFGVNNLLITPAGCGGRLGSLVTEADLGDNPLLDNFDELCLTKLGRKCMACVKKCPQQALAVDSFARQDCYELCLVNDKRFGDEKMAEVCGKCAAMMPCSLAIPKVRDLED